MLYLWVLLGLGWILFWRWGGINSKDTLKKKGPQAVEFVLDKKGKIIKMRLCPEAEAQVNKSQALLDEAKGMFERIMKAFSAGEVDQLESLVSPELWDVLKADIENRKTQKQTLEFNLLNFLSISLLACTAQKMTVMFISEQYNVLKDEQQKILEGADNQVTRMKDVWTFQKEGKKWRLMTAESEPVNA